MTARPARRGFTLVEVLCALALFGLGAVVLGGGYLNVLLGYAAVEEERDLAADVALARLTLLQTATREEAERGGDLTRPSNETFRWRAEIEPTTLPEVLQVDLVVEFSRLPPEEPIEVRQRLFLLRPDWVEAEDRDRLREEFRQRVEDARR